VRRVSLDERERSLSKDRERSLSLDRDLKEMGERLAQASLDLRGKEPNDALGLSLLGGHDGAGVVVEDSQMSQMEGQLSQLEMSQEVSSGDPSRFLHGTMCVCVCVCVSISDPRSVPDWQEVCLFLFRRNVDQ
jgi:hypothetical protein